MEIEFIRIISRRKIFTILVSTKIIQPLVKPNTLLSRKFHSCCDAFTSYISFQKKRSPTSIQSKKRSSVKLLQTVTLRPISKHLVESKSYPCNNTILQLIIHEVNRRGRDWPHSSSRIAPLSRIHSPCESLREATATQFRSSRFNRSDPIRSDPSDFLRISIRPFPTYHNSLRSHGRRCDPCSHRGIFSHRKINRSTSLC